MSTISRATIDDLYAVPDNQKAEIVDGEVRLMAPVGFMPARAGLNIVASLREHEW